MSSMIRWHNPPNASALLKYTDPVEALGEGTQEWSPFSGVTNHDVLNNRTPSQIKFAQYIGARLWYSFQVPELSWSEDRKHWWNEEIENFSGSKDGEAKSTDDKAEPTENEVGPTNDEAEQDLDTNSF